MDPDIFEKSVALYYEKKGFDIRTTPKSKDYGVDIIAEKDGERIAIQVKMYDKRSVNYKVVMYLFAGARHYNCTKSILISSGNISEEAKTEAEKMGIDIFENWQPPSDILKEIEKGTPNKEDNNEFSFSAVWEKYILPLKGQNIFTVTGQKNYILDVNWSYVERISSKRNKSKINIEIFRNCYHIILEKGKITRDEINHLYPGRASAIIFAILARIPFLIIVKKTKATLIYKKDKT